MAFIKNGIFDLYMNLLNAVKQKHASYASFVRKDSDNYLPIQSSYRSAEIFPRYDCNRKPVCQLNHIFQVTVEKLAQ